VYCENKKTILQISSLKDLLTQLPKEQFLQTHLSYAINIRYAPNWTNDQIYLSESVIPISRSKKNEVLEILNQAK
jgi:DNA-binding LytR/AlgR family response regulator